MVAVAVEPAEERSVITPLAAWYDEPDDEDDEDEEGAEPEPYTKPEPNENETKWSSNIWRLWNPQGSTTTDLPPVAIAALADSIAAAGKSPSIIVADLRAELSEGIASGLMPQGRAAKEEAAIGRLEAELCGGAVPAGKCCKCRVHDRNARMVGCQHLTLCTVCATSVTKHVNGHDERAKHLSRLMCPVCRGFEIEAGASAESIFAIIDRDGNGVIDSSELLMHLLVAGQEPDTIAELFTGLDANADGVISKEEFAAGFDRFLGIASCCPPAPKLAPEEPIDGEARSGGEPAVDGAEGEAGGVEGLAGLRVGAPPPEGAISNAQPEPA